MYPGPESPIEPLLGALSSLRDDNTSRASGRISSILVRPV